MENSGKAPLWLGIISLVVLFLGIGLKSFEYQYANYIIFGSFFLGAIYWIWSIIGVSTTNDLKKYQKSFWLIIVIAVPMLGGLIYQIAHQRKNKIAG